MKRILFAACLLLAGVHAATADETELFLVADLASQSDHAPVRAQAHELEAIYADLARVAGIDAKFVYSSDPDINAFATEVGDEKLVVVQEGLLGRFGGDRDAVAAVLGHELAHHKADHVRAGHRKQQGVRVLGAILGAVVGAKVGREHGQFAGALGGAAVGVGADLLALKFNRSQELEADRLALQWMIEAGYNPQGMLRLQQQLGAMDGKRRAAILSTHPTGAKRYQAAERLIAKLAPPPDLLARGVAPLVDEAALARALSAIEQAEAERVAQALQSGVADAPSAAALSPIEGIDFATYAAIGNQLLYAGEAGKSEVLARHRLDDAKLAQLSAGFGARMQEHPSLAQRYSVDYFRATQGRFAAHGQDLADSYELGRALQLDPPLPLETARDLHRRVERGLAAGADTAAMAALERDVLQPQGLSFYDYLIAHNWWSRQVTVAALAGDTAPMQAYFTAPDEGGTQDQQAAAAGVHVGDDVTMGDNVKIGGRSVKRAKGDD